MKVNREFLFDVDFVCAGCDAVIGVKGYMAVLKSTGMEVTCKHCRSHYLITEDGAHPITVTKE